MTPEKITIGILNHDNSVYEKYVAKSLDKLRGDFDLIIEKNNNPAQAYNDIINKSINKYIMLLHADVSFSNDFIILITKSIKKHPDFGAMGILGVKKNIFRKIKYISANESSMNEVDNLEPSCIIINKDHKLKFDNINFDEYHHYVEDYCMQIKMDLKLKIYTMYINTYIPINISFNEKNCMSSYFIHYNNTFSIKGSRWGKWEYYKKKLDNKWERKIITT